MIPGGIPRGRRPKVEPGMGPKLPPLMASPVRASRWGPSPEGEVQLIPPRRGVKRCRPPAGRRGPYPRRTREMVEVRGAGVGSTEMGSAPTQERRVGWWWREEEYPRENRRLGPGRSTSRPGGRPSGRVSWAPSGPSTRAARRRRAKDPIRFPLQKKKASVGQSGGGAVGPKDYPRETECARAARRNSVSVRVNARGDVEGAARTQRRRSRSSAQRVRRQNQPTEVGRPAADAEEAPSSRRGCKPRRLDGEKRAHDLYHPHHHGPCTQRG